MSTPAIILYGIPLSGHAHRVELFLTLLGVDYSYVEATADVRSSATFRALNPLGQAPVLVDGGLVLADSNAILVYLAKRYDDSGRWLPEAPAEAAEVQRWLSIAAGEVAYGPAKARFMTLFNLPGDLSSSHATAERVLQFMDAHLAERTWLAVERPTLADLACYSYVAHAPEGGVDLAPYGHVRAWLTRVEALPRFKAMPRSPIPA